MRKLYTYFRGFRRLTFDRSFPDTMHINYYDNTINFRKTFIINFTIYFNAGLYFYVNTMTKTQIY